jgi:hypothetical protein
MKIWMSLLLNRREEEGFGEAAEVKNLLAVKKVKKNLHRISFHF